MENGKWKMENRKLRGRAGAGLKPGPYKIIDNFVGDAGEPVLGWCASMYMGQFGWSLLGFGAAGYGVTRGKRRQEGSLPAVGMTWWVGTIVGGCWGTIYRAPTGVD
jgi:hypothetical protein